MHKVEVNGLVGVRRSVLEVLRREGFGIRDRLR